MGSLSLVCSTWNVGAADALPTADELHEWLHASGPHDIVAISLQEAVDLNSPGSYIGAHSMWLEGGALSQPLSSQAAAWASAVSSALTGQSLVLVARRQLVGVLLLVYVRDRHAPNCYARVGMLGTGPLGVGNKGAVATSLLLYGGTTLCLVGCHLAAGTKGPSARDRDAAAIEASLTFPPAGQRTALPLTISAHEFVVWFGDLNYRIQLPDDTVHAMVQQEDYGSLAAADELRRGQADGRVLPSYAEGALDFAPTYKYDPHTTTYDTSAKRRAPAWCDRVLWRRSEQVQCVSYTRHERPWNSDHRPVSAVLRLATTAAVGSGSEQLTLTDADVAPASQGPCWHLMNVLHGCMMCICSPASDPTRNPGGKYDQLM